MTAQGDIVHVVSSLGLGGAERFALDLARLQRRRGQPSRVVSFGSSRDTLVEEALEAKTPFVCLADVGGTVRRFGKLARSVAPWRARAVHVHSPWCLKGVLPLLPLVRGSIVYTRHGAHSYDSFAWRGLHTAAHRFIDHVTFVSEEGLRVHERAFGSTRPSYHVVDNGVDLDVPQHVERSSDLPIRLGCVGRLVELKGQRRVMEALLALVRSGSPPLELHLFGDGPDRRALEEWASAHLPGAVRFHGAVVDRNRIYSQIDVLVSASRMEGLSLAIMEAMARSIPVVATEVGGNSRLVVSGDTGLLVPLGDGSALCAALKALVREPEYRRRLGSGARSHMQTHFSLEATADRFDALYSEPAARNGGDRSAA